MDIAADFMTLLGKLIAETDKILQGIDKLEPQVNRLEENCEDVKGNIDNLEENDKIDENNKSLSLKMDENYKLLMEAQVKNAVELNVNVKSLSAKIDENFKSLSCIIDGNSKSLKAQIDKNSIALRAKIDEIAKSQDAKMEKKFNKMQQINAESRNIIKKNLQDMLKALSIVEVQINKGDAKQEAAQKSMKALKSTKNIPPAETYHINLGIIASKDQKYHLETEFRNLIERINASDGVTRQLKFSQMDKSNLLEQHKKKLAVGVKFHCRKDKTFSRISNSSYGFSPREIDDLFSTTPVPADFSLFIIIILKNTNRYDYYNEWYDLSKPF